MKLYYYVKLEEPISAQARPKGGQRASKGT